MEGMDFLGGDSDKESAENDEVDRQNHGEKVWFSSIYFELYLSHEIFRGSIILNKM